MTAPGPMILSTQFGVNWLAVVETFVGGSVTGISPKKGMAVCLNLTTGRAVRIRLDRATSWNCEDAGLVMNPGDKIHMLLHVTGTAH